MSEEETSPVVNVEAAPEETMTEGPWGGSWRVLTPSMRKQGGSLGMVRMHLKPGHTTCPFHWHAREDEVFYVLSGRGVLRYGEQLHELGPGDTISCPAGTRTAHQIANPFDEDLLYLAIGPHDPHEVCYYAADGKLLVRAAGRIGHMADAPYMDGEPEEPRIFELWRTRRESL